MLADLQYKELKRLENEISATMVSLRVHHESQATQTYQHDDALNSLATFMQRSKEVESEELSKKFNSIMLVSCLSIFITT